MLTQLKLLQKQPLEMRLTGEESSYQKMAAWSLGPLSSFGKAGNHRCTIIDCTPKEQMYQHAKYQTQPSSV